MVIDKEESGEEAAAFAASILSGIFKKEEVKEAIKEDAQKLKDTGGPAFPSMIAPSPEHGYNLLGMNLRDWFAGLALQGWAAGRNSGADFASSIPEMVASSCYKYADAMLAQRSKK